MNQRVAIYEINSAPAIAGVGVGAAAGVQPPHAQPHLGNFTMAALSHDPEAPPDAALRAA
jgi:hypothetical protein